MEPTAPAPKSVSLFASSAPLSGQLFEPPTPNGRGEAFLLIPGAGASPASDPLRTTAAHIAARGVTVLIGGTRGQGWAKTPITPAGTPGAGASFERLADAPIDIAAWLNFLTELGHSHLHAVGHSLGALKLGLYAESVGEGLPEKVSGVTFVSPPDLRTSSLKKAYGEAAFAADLAAASALAPDDLFPATVPSRRWVSSGTWLEKCANRDQGFDVSRLLASVATEIPTRVLFGSHEISQHHPLTGALALEIERRFAGIEVLEADHLYHGREQQLAAALLASRVPITSRPFVPFSSCA